MRYVRQVVWVALAGLPLLIPLSRAAGDQKENPPSQSVEAQAQKPASDVRMPVYKPPPRGAPGGRVGGGTRGPGHEWPILSVLAPDHTGLTVHDQPSLFWYLSSSTTYPIEVTIVDNQAIQPLLANRLSPPVQPGVHRIRLADYDLRLSRGVWYQWFVALVVDPDSRSKDIIAGGFIERTEPPEPLLVKIARAGKAEAPHLYAEAGVWYDAVMAISDLIDAAPHDSVLRNQRAALVDQVGLPEIAEHDRRHRPAN